MTCLGRGERVTDAQMVVVVVVVTESIASVLTDYISVGVMATGSKLADPGLTILQSEWQSALVAFLHYLPLLSRQVVVRVIKDGS